MLDQLLNYNAIIALLDNLEDVTTFSKLYSIHPDILTAQKLYRKILKIVTVLQAKF